MGKIASPFVLVLAAAFLVLVIALVRARKLKEEYSVIWVVAAILVLAVTLSWRLVEIVAPYLGVVYTPSAVFYLAIVFLMGVNLALSVQISRLERDRIRTAQAVALLEAEVRELRGRIPGCAADATREEA
ncbi:MAG: DUF2304 family protein [candidate division Zixibacteria bacterium]|nr:DUF2304 family protein [candidate division Zixibacteria bacterium]